MEKIKILVACHKPGPVYSDDVYTPIHVGRAISRCKEDMDDMIGDDTGDNISEKNPQYCELTAQYWAWKNLHDVEYIGFCHYRRFFDIKIDSNCIDDYYKNHDVVMLEYVYSHSIYRNILQYITLDDLHIFMMVLKKMYPEYEQSTIDYMWGNIAHTNCMFICKKSLFDDYAKWMFSILLECEKYIKPSPYTRGKRTFAYLGEYFMPLYMHHHHCRVYKASAVECVGKTIHEGIYQKIMNKVKMLHIKAASPLINRPKTFEDFYFPEVLVGFNNDGIKI